MIAPAREVLGVAVVVLLAGMVASCTTVSEPTPQSTRGATSVTGQLHDPLDSVTDPNSTDFVGTLLTPVLHTQGVGPSTYQIDKPQGPTAIRFYVACYPDSDFTVRVGTFFSGRCASKFQNSGQFSTGSAANKLDVRLEIPKGVRYWILALPMQ